MSNSTLANDISITSGFAFSSALFDPEHGEPLIRIRDIQGQKTVVKYTGTYSEEYLVNTGELLVGMDGDFNVVRWLGTKALLNQRVCKIQSISAELHQGFLFWYLQPKLKDIHATTPQTTVKHLSVKDIYAIEKPNLNFFEQEMVADVLDTIDSQIRETEAIIAKLQRVKQGLLHDLLTRGVDENGELRPSYEDAPELYKPSELGWIPNDWSIVTWGECTEDWAMGPRFSSDKYDVQGNVATLRTTDMNLNGGINHETMPVAQLSLFGLEQHILQKGDFVITRSGTCGICGVFKGFRLPVLPGAFLIRFRFNEQLDADFMSIYMNSAIGKPLVLKYAEGGVQKNLRGTSLCNIEFPKAPYNEQLVIKDRVLGVQNRIQNEVLCLNKLKLNKTGLMDDLLTGKRRVTDLINQQQVC